MPNETKFKGLMATVKVELGERSYPIEIGAGRIEGLGEALAKAFPPRPVTVVTNLELVKLGWASKVETALERAGYRVSRCEIPGGEEHKTIDTVTMIHDQMLREKATRQSGVAALGGGIVGDVAGFAAATLLRGVAYIQLPTTLLAMVDSSVGGKTGVNHAMGKNLIGAFWQPVFVGVELECLRTLPDAELRAGMAEVIKYGVIADAELFEYLETNVEKALARDATVLAHLVRRSCEIKAGVVGRDEREEGGLRAILNYGHTFCHAAEALSDFKAIRHGEGVAMGMVAAARLAEARGLVGPEVGDRIEKLCARAGLPTRMLRFGVEKYWAKMGSDKKVRDGKIRFVLPEAMGRVGVYGDVTREEVERCLEKTTRNETFS
jgi:3-dehydroquinate synthase